RKTFHSIIIAPQKEAIVYGWFVTQKKSDEFQVTEYARSAAAELKVSTPVGIITASFAACWENEQLRPHDEPVNPPNHSRDAYATGRGARIGTRAEAITRNIGVIRGAVSIRYLR